MSGQPVVQMYSSAWCPFCAKARTLFRERGVSVAEIDVDADPARREEMRLRTGRATVPQIYIGEYHVGGFDDLLALEHAGGLDELLSPPQQGETGQ